MSYELAQVEAFLSVSPINKLTLFYKSLTPSFATFTIVDTIVMLKLRHYLEKI